MKTAAQLSIIGAAALTSAVIHPNLVIPLVWIGLNFIALGHAHRIANPYIFGKSKSGQLSAIRTVAFLPLLIYTWGAWYLIRLLSTEPAKNTVMDGIEIGRRLTSREIESSYDNYVDLTAEFYEPESVSSHPGYVSLPILDASTPSPDALRAAIKSLREGSTFIHCAQGHGRTGLFTAALLMSRGAARNADEALSMIQCARPGVRLNKMQMDFLRALKSVP